MKCYETMLILRPTLDKDAVEAAVAKIGEMVTKEKGEVVRTDHWGKRKLAYPIKKEVIGYYCLLYFKGEGKEVGKLEAALKIFDPVIRFMTIQIEPEQLDRVVPQPSELRPLDEEGAVSYSRAPESEDRGVVPEPAEESLAEAEEPGEEDVEPLADEENA